MASAWKQRRVTGSGEERWHVKWAGPSVERADGTIRARLHIGSFKTEREADRRIKWANDEWSAGRVPDPKRIVVEAHQGARLSVVADEWLASRLDIASSSRQQYQSRIDRIKDDLGGELVARVTPKDVRAWVATLSREFKPATVGVYLHVLRVILDFADADPNPARHRTVKPPKGRTTNTRIRLPTTKQIAAIRKGLATDDQRRLLDFLEDTGARIAEACALDWKDVGSDQVLIRGTKSAAGERWVDAATHPVRLLGEERGTGSVFELTSGGMRNAMASASTDLFSPHDLRHLHGSRLIHRGVSPAVVAARLGNKVATTIKTYTHVVAPD